MSIMRKNQSVQSNWWANISKLHSKYFFRSILLFYHHSLNFRSTSTFTAFFVRRTHHLHKKGDPNSQDKTSHELKLKSIQNKLIKSYYKISFNNLRKLTCNTSVIINKDTSIGRDNMFF